MTSENQSPARWIVFGVGTTEPNRRGEIDNIGAVVVEKLADRFGCTMQDCGPISLGKVFSKDAKLALRLVCPNTSLAMGDDAVMLTKTKVDFDLGCAVLVYGDNSFALGKVKVKRKGGLAGGPISAAFIRTYGDKQVIRIRVGIGSKGKRAAVVSDEACQRLARGVNLAANVVSTLLEYGYEAAVKKSNHEDKPKPTTPIQVPTLLPIDSGGPL